MKRTIASKSGGYHIDLTPEEEVETRSEWARNDAAQVAEQLLADEKVTKKAAMRKEIQTKLQLTDEQMEVLSGL